jgi:hypothetical protein
MRAAYLHQPHFSLADPADFFDESSGNFRIPVFFHVFDWQGILRYSQVALDFQKSIFAYFVATNAATTA